VLEPSGSNVVNVGLTLGLELLGLVGLAELQAEQKNASESKTAALSIGELWQRRRSEVKKNHRRVFQLFEGNRDSEICATPNHRLFRSNERRTVGEGEMGKVTRRAGWSLDRGVLLCELVSRLPTERQLGSPGLPLRRREDRGS
jgi:hypothetical protein